MFKKAFLYLFLMFQPLKLATAISNAIADQLLSQNNYDMTQYTIILQFLTSRSVELIEYFKYGNLNIYLSVLWSVSNPSCFQFKQFVSSIIWHIWALLCLSLCIRRMCICQQFLTIWWLPLIILIYCNPVARECPGV